MLEKNRDNIAKALPGLAKYQITQGETVASGYYYDAFEPNLIPAQILQPFLDYAFGFRRGSTPGSRPTTRGHAPSFRFPSTEFPEAHDDPEALRRPTAVASHGLLVAGGAFVVRSTYFAPRMITACSSALPASTRTTRSASRVSKSGQSHPSSRWAGRCG